MTEDIKCHGSYFIAKDGKQTFFKWFQIIESLSLDGFQRQPGIVKLLLQSLWALFIG